jgi:hypothetical protein
MIVDVTQMLGDFRPMERLIFRMDQKDVVECVNTSDGNKRDYGWLSGQRGVRYNRAGCTLLKRRGSNHCAGTVGRELAIVIRVKSGTGVPRSGQVNG